MGSLSPARNGGRVGSGARQRQPQRRRVNWASRAILQIEPARQIRTGGRRAVTRVLRAPQARRAADPAAAARGGRLTLTTIPAALPPRPHLRRRRRPCSHCGIRQPSAARTSRRRRRRCSPSRVLLSPARRVPAAPGPETCARPRACVRLAVRWVECSPLALPGACLRLARSHSLLRRGLCLDDPWGSAPIRTDAAPDAPHRATCVARRSASRALRCPHRRVCEPVVPPLPLHDPLPL
jgi:hypothetical protein